MQCPSNVRQAQDQVSFSNRSCTNQSSSQLAGVSGDCHGYGYADDSNPLSAAQDSISDCSAVKANNCFFFSDNDLQFFRSTDPSSIRDPPHRGQCLQGPQRAVRQHKQSEHSPDTDPISDSNKTACYVFDSCSPKHRSSVQFQAAGTGDSRGAGTCPPRVDPQVATSNEFICGFLLSLQDEVARSGSYNYARVRRPVPSGLNIAAWRQNLVGYHDAHLVDFLEFGWPVNFDRSQPLLPALANHPSASSFDRHIQHYIDTEISHGALLGPYSNPPILPFHSSPLMTAPKKDSEYRRVVMDLSWPAGCSINDGVSREAYVDGPMTIKLPTVDYMEARLIELGRGAFMYKTDLSRGYRQLRIDPSDWGFLGFTHNGRFFVDMCPPFGLRSSAMMMQRTSKAISFIHGRRGLRSEPYIDDFGGAERDNPTAHTALSTLQDTFVDLGIQEAKHKVCPPSTQMVWLGVLFDSVEFTMSVPPDKLREVIQMVRDWRGRTRASRREMQSLFGSLQFVSAVSPPARAFTNRILEALREAPHKGYTTLSAGFKADLRFFDQLLAEFKGVKIINKASFPFQDSLELDACLSGCGGCTDSKYYAAPFPPHIIAEAHSIAHLEMLNLVVAVKLWATAWAGWSVRVFCDNANTCSAITTAHPRDPYMQRCVREIFLITAIHDIDLRIEHRPGRLMTRADALSREHLGTKFKNIINNDPKLISSKRIIVHDDLFKVTEDL